MESINITEVEIDAIGEIMNISMGAAATALSSILDKRVIITTPNVQVISSGNYEFQALQPAIGVEINYISGITGTNIMIMKESDIKEILGLMLGTDYSQTEFVMDEMCVSAVCESMNQMMGSSSTALSDFLNRPINISTPISYQINSTESFKRKYFGDNTELLSVKFDLEIEGLVNSEFASVMSKDLASELVSLFYKEVSPPLEEVQESNNNQSVPTNTDSIIRNEPKVVETKEEKSNPSYNVMPVNMEKFVDRKTTLPQEQADNLQLIMSVPLQITVEIGRTKKQIKDILELSEGSIIELNKPAGAQVDILVNGKPIARGDVVLVDDNYGVRVTEIINQQEIIKML